ncbi:MAG TPA: DnaD domain protein [Anaerovoracaceae bacterium]|nr:DnaD domain protein [Anaerovoracaceae bacterium]
MSFEREKINTYYLHNTAVENVFINEFIPDAPGNYVKVYLFALMYADIRVSIDNEDIAKQLSLQVEDVLAAWTYWEGRGVIRKLYPDPSDILHYRVEFIDLKEQIYGMNDKSKKKKESVPEKLKGIMDDGELKQMYAQIEQITGRLFHGKEPVTILNWIGDYEISPEIVLFAYEYCKNERNNTRLNYVGAVIKEWAERGLKSRDDIEAHLQENDNRHYLYKRVMKALGFMRNPTEEERRIMDVWFDDLSIHINTVLEACKKTSGISNPNINYVNAVLTPKKKTVSDVPKDGAGDNKISAVIKSYEKERKANEAAAQKRREEVYKTVPRIYEIEEEIRNISMEISKNMLSQGEASKTKIKSLRSSFEKLSNERSYLLTDNNYQIDYLDTWYNCTKCKDLGILDNGARCSCFARKLEDFGKKV